MTKRQAIQKSAQLQMSLQVMFDNAAKTGMDGAIVKCSLFGPIGFEFRVASAGYIEFNPLKIAQEIEKILPNVRVTDCELRFSERSFSFVAKELGRIGTYSFTFVHVRA